jgi:hypothetical protein
MSLLAATSPFSLDLLAECFETAVPTVGPSQYNNGLLLLLGPYYPSFELVFDPGRIWSSAGLGEVVARDILPVFKAVRLFLQLFPFHHRELDRMERCTTGEVYGGL